MKKYKEFPYPIKTNKLTVYGRKGCPYCEKMKNFINKVYNNDDKKVVKYHDIFEIIDSGHADDVSNFKKKMRPFIRDYSTVPMVFIQGDFIGGYDDFCELVTKSIKNFDTKNKTKIKEIIYTNSEKEVEKKINKIKNKLKKCTSNN